MIYFKSSSRTVFIVSGIMVVLLLAGCASQIQSRAEATGLPKTVAAPPTATPESTVNNQETKDGDPIASPSPTTTPTTVVEPSATPTQKKAPASCQPTPPDALGPFYLPGAPERSSVGQGHLLQGKIQSSQDCAVIAGARLEFWLAGPDGQYGDDYRATLFSANDGSYSFESSFPPAYGGRPPHIHLRVTAEGYDTLVTQYYPPAGQPEGNLDLVLAPASTTAGSQSEPEISPIAEAEDAVPAPTLFGIAWEERSLFATGLIESQQGILEQLPGASVYHLELEMSDDLLHLQGREEVLFTNREDTPLNEIYFRLFPNLAGGSSEVTALRVNNQPVEPSYELQASAMKVPLSPALPPGGQTVIQLDFRVDVPSTEGGNYGTFALQDKVLALAHFYPLIPVYDDEGWNVEIAPSIGDVIYADASFYLVRVTAPASLTLVASGIEINLDSQDQQQTLTFAAGPMRDFYLVASERYSVTSRTVGQTTVNSYAPAELSGGAERALDYAAQALHSFNERFGPYPFTEFDLVSTTTSALGIEYPGLVAILIDLYEQSEAASASRLQESVVAHEVAHQWFYSVVGNDQVDEPWVDEAIAQYATLLYYTDLYGAAGAAGFRGSLERRWERVNRAEIPIGQPVRDYTPEEYSAIVYGRGPLFIEMLAETMGQEAFEKFIQDYYETYQWGIATGDGFKALAEQHCACDLTPLFQTWVYTP